MHTGQDQRRMTTLLKAFHHLLTRLLFSARSLNQIEVGEKYNPHFYPQRM
jgi:hypothetical protein